jgi:L-alanine-DL-glutamate epimerase-like enolase superfamily enzyme
MFSHKLFEDSTASIERGPMSKSTDVSIKEVSVSTEPFQYRSPIKFGGRVVTDVLLLNVQVTLESRMGKTATGRGSMPLGNIWAWPSNVVPAAESLQSMQQLAPCIQRYALANSYTGHPLEIAHHLSAALDQISAELAAELKLGEAVPKLAQLVVFSPFDAAVHDAFGRMLQRSSFDLLGAEFVNHDLSHYLSSDFQGEYLDAYTLRTPKAKLPLYHLVGALDPVLPEELTQPVGDGLPETLADWIQADGLTHLKIKLNGDDLDWDVQRVLNIDTVAAQAQAKRNCRQWFYSTDFNEKCANVEYVIEFLHRVRAGSPGAFERIQYIEQPTHRDLRSNSENKMFAAAEIKPVVIDESLVDYETFLLAREQGYSGVALKACKGQSEALMMGAAAQKYNMFLCVQDLTCVGASFLHSASLAAHIPTVSAIEGNGRQYCPAGNAAWQSAYPGMFEIQTGEVQTSELAGIGLGFDWQ